MTLEWKSSNLIETRRMREFFYCEFYAKSVQLMFYSNNYFVMIREIFFEINFNFYRFTVKI